MREAYQQPTQKANPNLFALSTPNHPWPGSNRMHLAAASGQLWEPRISPNSERGAYVEVKAGILPQVYVTSLMGGQKIAVLPEGFTRPDWSPDGARIVCDSVVPTQLRSPSQSMSSIS